MTASKIIFMLWLTTTGNAAIVLAGTPFTVDSLFPATIFSVALLAILVYYGWHVKSPVHSPSEHALLLIAGVVFLIVAVIHFFRLMFGFDFIVGDLGVPVWLSWVGFALAAYLSYASFHFALRMKRRGTR
jgi:hypothetical protein